MTHIKLKPINQQVVVVVGASSGIGRATALKFAKQGAKLVIAARSLSGLTSLVDEISQIGAEVIAVPADVAVFEQVKTIADKAIEHYGRLDTWVHLAATAVIARFEQMTPEEFQRVIQVNLLGQVYGAIVALPHLKQEGRGALIHITSVEARRSLPLQSAYAASKHGIEGFLDSLRVELQHDGIPVSVTNVMPATINTPFYNNARTKLGVKPTGIPPYYQPELVADAVVHVAEHPMREIIVGDAGIFLDLLQKTVPQLVDTILKLVAVDGQHTKEHKTENDSHNLFKPVEEDNRIRGDYDHLAIPSFLELFKLNSPVKWGTVAGIAALALLATQIFANSDSP